MHIEYFSRLIGRHLCLVALVAACCCFAVTAVAQTQPACVDVVYLRDGSRFIGQLRTLTGDSIEIRIQGGFDLKVARKEMRRILQRCDGMADLGSRVYNFREKGWYNATRFNFLVGRTWGSNPVIGASLYHSTGYAFRRELGVGVGGGVDFFVPSDDEAATYPVFAEIRGYLRPSNATPFYALGLGWGFTERGSGQQTRFERTYQWEGGAAMQAELGYRFGNHFMALVSLRIQHKTRSWQSLWDESYAVEQIVYRRLGLGIGFLF
jgi:hypothetical protein